MIGAVAAAVVVATCCDMMYSIRVLRRLTSTGIRITIVKAFQSILTSLSTLPTLGSGRPYPFPALKTLS